MEDENKYAEDIELEDGDTRQMYEHFKFVADKGQELLRIDKFLVARTGNISRNRIQQAADAGCILVNGGRSSRIIGSSPSMSCPLSWTGLLMKTKFFPKTYLLMLCMKTMTCWL